MTARNFLVYGLIAGLIAGIAAFAVAYFVGEPPIDEAIAVEEAAAEAEDHDHDHDEVGGHSHGDDEEGGVTRGQQAGPGLATGIVLLSVVFGGATGIAAAFAVGRLGSLTAAASTALVAAAGFVSFTLVPWLKYPPNPPAVGDGDTIGERSALYFSFLAISVLLVVAAFFVGRQLLARNSAWVAAAIAGVGYLVIILIVGAVWAPIDEVPDDFPSNTLYSFRVSALLTQATIWAGIGLVLSGLVHRATTSSGADPEPQRAATASV